MVARAETPKENGVAALSALSHVFPGLGLHMDLLETRSTLLTNFQSSFTSSPFLVSFGNELSPLSTNSLRIHLKIHLLARMYLPGIELQLFLGRFGARSGTLRVTFWTLI